MKKLFLLIVLSLSVMGLSAQGIQFTEGSWNNALSKAKAENKLVFIDVFTSWCGPCKMMATKTFTQKVVGDFFNSHFVNFHIDAEKGEGIAVAKKYGVSAYPTCMFINSKGEVVYKFLGSKNATELLKEADNALKYRTLGPKMKQMKATYAAGNRTKPFLKEYVTCLKESGEPTGAALTDYMKLMTDDELYSNEGCDDIKSMTVFDKPLLDRIIAHYKSVSMIDSLQKKLYSPIMSALSGCLETVLVPGNSKYETAFNQMLDMKGQVIVKKDVMGALFGGIIYRPDEQLRVLYYSNANLAKFKNLFEGYMQNVIQKKDADNVQASVEEARMKGKQKYDSLIAAKDSVKAKKIKGGMTLVLTILDAQHESDASFVLSCTEKYWNSLSKPTAADKAKCISWVEQAYKYNDGVTVAYSCASLLKKMGDKARGKQMLQNSIAIAKTDITGSTAPERIATAEGRLQEFE
jgi:thiol-disulfide isomerase/thioredoxin